MSEDELDIEAEMEQERAMELERHFMGGAQPPQSMETDNDLELPPTWNLPRRSAPPVLAGAQRPAPGSRKRPAHNYNELNDSSDDGSQAGSSDRGQPFRRQVDTVTNRDDDAFDPPVQGDDMRSSHSKRLHQGLDQVPGWSPMIMGHGIDPKPPTFETGLPGHWLQWKGEGPFSGGKCRPARVLDMGFVAAWQQAPDAERVSDMSAQTELGARSRTVATCALMGMLSVGMAKGFIASDNHSELTLSKKKEDEDLGKLRKQWNGKIKTYTYCPNANDPDPAEAQKTAMMFCFVHVAMHDVDGKYVGFKILMLIFDKGFSTDELVRKVMEENAEISSSGQINGCPEQMRNPKMERQNKLQRTQITDENLETTAGTQYKRICSVQDWIKFLDSVGGKGDGHEGRPYYADIAKDTPPGCATNPFGVDPGKEYGGKHPVGPTVSHNHKRYVAPSEDGPGVNVSIAGTLDQRSKPIALHPSLIDPNDWYDDEHNFCPPQHVIDNGWCHVMHDPSRSTNIFNAPLPNRMHGNVEPEECLLRIFWETHKDSCPILKKAQQRGLATFEQNRDAVISLFHRMEDSADPDQQRLARAVLETDMLSNDSIDKSVAEEAIIERRAYGDVQQTDEHGECKVLSVRQALRDIAGEQVKTHGMVEEWDKRARGSLSEEVYNAQQAQFMQFDAKEKTLNRKRDHAEATMASIKLGLQRMEHSLTTKKQRKTIPPGYFDVAFTGLRAAVKEAGAIAQRRAAHNLGRKVDPENPNAMLGTANIGFAHNQSLVATDLTPWGHYRAFLMHLFSAGTRIAGRDVKLMLEMHCHAFEPFQEVSFFLLLCGGPGSGKSMRAKRLMSLLPKKWVMGSGSASQKAGMNGGFDFLCGRLVYYDEIINDYASTDSERIEYLKSITMEQRVLNTRTVKTIGEGGLESFTTIVLDSLHYESYLMCTNCGPLGLKGDNVEPSTNRSALTDRSIHHIVHSTDEHATTGDIEFDPQTASDEVKQQINKYRVISSLVAYVLIFIKHIPACHPNMTYANMLCNKWYEILWNEYNLPVPAKRKKIKLRMLMLLFSAESGAFEKFGIPESGVDFDDMKPDANGHLSPFAIEQLADVVRSMQRCLDFEVILNAWSHSLDHSAATAAHTFQMKTVLAQLHGSELDRRRLDGTPPPAPAVCAAGGSPGAAAAAPAPVYASTAEASPVPPPVRGSQGRSAEVVLADDDPNYIDHDTLGDMEANFQLQFPSGPAQGTPAVPLGISPVAPAATATTTTAAPGASPSGASSSSQQLPMPPPPPQQARRRPLQTDADGIESPSHANGQQVLSTATTVRTMTEGMTRKRCAEVADELATQRELRCEFSSRVMSKKIPRTDQCEHVHLTAIFTDGRDKNREPMHKMTSTGKVMSAKRAAGACMPSASDVLDRGVDEGFLKNIVCGMESREFDDAYAKIGIKAKGWEYEQLATEATMKGPADFDFNWARRIEFNQGSGGADQAQQGGGGAKQKSVWSRSARIIKAASANSPRTFSLMKVHSMSVESMRDVIFMMAQTPIENRIRIPKNISQRSNLNRTASMQSGTRDIKEMDVETIHPRGMLQAPGKPDPMFLSPMAIDRPHNSTVAQSGFQTRLDHLTNHRALPACILPENFERGVPIKECEACNGIYFNKHTASEQASLVLEMGLYLSNVPGIAGGKYSAVPDSFKVIDTKRLEDAQDALLEESRAAHSDAEMADVNAAAQPREVVQDTFPALSPSRSAEEDAEEDFVEPEDSPLHSDEQSSEHSALAHGVEWPELPDTGINPTAGACDRAARASIDPSAMVPTLPFEWDQSAIFFTIKMAQTLHNDVQPYVENVRETFPDVYEDEDCEETLLGLPQMALRFPGVTDNKRKHANEVAEEKTSSLWPLSVSIPLEQSRFCDMERHIKASRASRGLTEAVHSIAHGRKIEYNDPEVLEHEADARGVNSGFNMSGNLFARSAWQRFTLSALDARGMSTPEEEDRVNDQGLCMRYRVRNRRAMAQRDDHPGNPHLSNCTEARPVTFTAQERRKRERCGEEEEDELCQVQSLTAKRRALELELANSMLVDSCNRKVSV